MHAAYGGNLCLLTWVWHNILGKTSTTAVQSVCIHPTCYLVGELNPLVVQYHNHCAKSFDQLSGHSIVLAPCANKFISSGWALFFSAACHVFLLSWGFTCIAGWPGQVAVTTHRCAFLCILQPGATQCMYSVAFILLVLSIQHKLTNLINTLTASCHTWLQSPNQQESYPVYKSGQTQTCKSALVGQGWLPIPLNREWWASSAICTYPYLIPPFPLSLPPPPPLLCGSTCEAI